MSDYLQQIKLWINTLNFVGSPMDEEDIELYILNELPLEFQAFNTAVKLRPQSIIVTELHDLLLIEEQQLALRSDVVTPDSTSIMSSAFNATISSTYSDSYKNNRQGKHRGRGRRKFQRSKVYCQICKKQGHVAFDCFYRHDLNFQRPAYQQNMSQRTENTSATPAYFLPPTTPYGASNHISPNINSVCTHHILDLQV